MRWVDNLECPLIPLEGEEIVVFFEQSQPPVGAIQDMVHQPAGSISSRSRHARQAYTLCKPV
jgi:hypothetical protein